jgi:DNA-directed RNA polymerase alpha subunit
VNTGQIICTINEKRRVMMGMEVGVGRGYAFADDQKFMTEV